ncbi:hypothetical protein FRC09_001321 [Ceratobasidium sp. 395]|nr:hypothetical protein FRC09_001321 [Ceratobasidium sp. 395]
MAMKDAKGYSGGIVFVFTMASGSGCNLAPDPMQPNTLDVSASGSVQCGQANVVVNNGTAPYKLELVPGDGQPRTLYYATNKFGFTIDMAAGTQYFLVVTDSKGYISTTGIYSVEGSSDNSCVGKAQTVTVGMFSTLYSGSGVVVPTATSTSSSGSSSITSTGALPQYRSSVNDQNLSGTHKSTQPMTIGLIVGILVLGLALICALLFFCRRRRQKRSGAPTDTDHNPHGYKDPGYAGYSETTPQMRQTFGPLGTVYEEGQGMYPSYAVPEIQSDMPGATPAFAAQMSSDERTFQPPSVEYGNTIFTPWTNSSHTSASQFYPPALPSQQSSQVRPLSQASDPYTMGSSDKPPPSALSEADSSAPLQQQLSSWVEQKPSSSRAPMSPPPRAGTAATRTSSIPPTYKEAWPEV